jgi:ribosomal protein L11
MTRIAQLLQWARTRQSSDVQVSRVEEAARLDAEDAYRRGVEDSISTIEESATAMGVTCADDQVKVAIVRLERLKEGNGND